MGLKLQCCLLITCAVVITVQAEVITRPNYHQQGNQSETSCEERLKLKMKESSKLKRKITCKEKLIKDLMIEREADKKCCDIRKAEILKGVPSGNSQNDISSFPKLCKAAGKNLPMVSLNSGKYYLSGNDKLSWYHAQKFCRQNGLELLSIENKFENMDITKKVNELCTLKTSPYEGYWTSGTDQGKEGQWYWASTGADFTYTDWPQREPNNKNGRQHCAAIWTFGGVPHWDDYQCEYKNRFICELPVLCKNK